MMTYYLDILMYVLLLAPGASVPAGEVVVEVSPGFKGVVMANTTPGAVEFIVPGTIAASGPDKATCEKWGNEVRKTKAKDMGLKDYRQLKYRCDLRAVAY